MSSTTVLYLWTRFSPPPRLVIYGGMLATFLFSIVIAGSLAGAAIRSGTGIAVLCERRMLTFPLIAAVGFPGSGPLDAAEMLAPLPLMPIMAGVGEWLGGAVSRLIASLSGDLT
jgi:hypothetical protein